MALTVITATTPQPPLQIADGDIVTFRGWYTNSFVGIDGVTPIQGGNGQSGFFYEEPCSLNEDGFPVIPELSIQPTTGSNPTAGFFGALFVNGAFAQMIFGYPQATAGWQIPPDTPTTFGALALYNAAVQLLYPPNTYPTFNQVVLLIQQLAGNQQYAAVGINGIGQPSVAPDVASEPIFLGQNDPSVMFGSIEDVGIVPRSNGPNSYVASQIADDGTDVSVNTLNSFQAGDFNFTQNGSRVEVNDNTGRVGLFAGGNEQAEYAGIAGVCEGTDPGQVLVQATGYSYLSGQNGVAALGDGLNENNGTRIIVDDVARLIKVINLPTVDPLILNAIWSDEGTLKVSEGI